MNINRENLYAKIRALLAKTQNNGCTEAEAMAALAKARAMMDAYEVTDEDLKLTKAEAAIIQQSAAHDPNGVRRFMSAGVAKFCGVKSWISSGRHTGETRGQVMFCGLPADVALAQWLMGSLESFVRRELAAFLMTCGLPKGQRRRPINSFVMGATARISARLTDLARESERAVLTQVNSRALAVVKTHAIDDAMVAAGIKLHKARSSSRNVDWRGYDAGRAAGDRATFGKPVGGSGQRLLT